MNLSTKNTPLGGQLGGLFSSDLMCAGANANEKNPSSVNPYLKYRAGWAQEVVRITADLNAGIMAGVNRFFIYRKSATEYFIIENRQKAGRDEALPAEGPVIWHVDELGDNQYEQMTLARHYECSLEQADGRHDLEDDPNNIGDRCP